MVCTVRFVQLAFLSLHSGISLRVFPGVPRQLCHTSILRVMENCGFPLFHLFFHSRVKISISLPAMIVSASTGQWQIGMSDCLLVHKLYLRLYIIGKWHVKCSIFW